MDSTATIRIDPALFNPVAVNLAKRLPKPQNDCGLVIYGSPTKQDEKQIVGKTDWQLNARHSVMGRVLFTNFDKPVPYELSPDNILTVATGGRTERTASSPSATPGSSARRRLSPLDLAANYTDVAANRRSMFNMTDLGVKNFYTGYQPKYATTNVTNGFNLGGGTENDSTLRTFSTTSLNSDLSLTRGTHQISAWAGP